MDGLVPLSRAMTEAKRSQEFLFDSNSRQILEAPRGSIAARRATFPAFPLAPAKRRHRVSRTDSVKTPKGAIKRRRPVARSVFGARILLTSVGALCQIAQLDPHSRSQIHILNSEKIRQIKAVGGPDRAREAAACSSPKTSCSTQPFEMTI